MTDFLSEVKLSWKSPWGCNASSIRMKPNKCSLLRFNDPTWSFSTKRSNLFVLDYRDAGKELEKAMLGKDGHQDRWRFCVTDTDNVLGFAVGAMFVR